MVPAPAQLLAPEKEQGQASPRNAKAPQPKGQGHAPPRSPKDKATPTPQPTLRLAFSCSSASLTPARSDPCSGATQHNRASAELQGSSAQCHQVGSCRQQCQVPAAHVGGSV